MAKFFALTFLFWAINIGNSGSVSQKNERKNVKVQKIENKDGHDVISKCFRAKSVDPEMNMDCCTMGICANGIIKFDNLYYCDGKHLFSSCTVLIRQLRPKFKVPAKIEMPFS